MRVSLGHSTDTAAGCTEWSVLLDVESPYGPDIADDLASRARDLLRLMISDSLHLSVEHDD